MRNQALIILSIILVFSCKEKVREFDGFTQKELEYLLAADDAKVWERVSMEEDGEEILPANDCEMENYLIFIQGGVGQPKPLLFAYNPSICDSLDFCSQYPAYCQSDTLHCADNPAFCESLGEGILYLGTWYAKSPFIKNDRSDTLVFEINNKNEAIFVTSITAQHATFQYKNRKGTSGGTITENYIYLEPEEE